MRLSAATLVPVLFLLLLEGGLRFAGYGYSTRLFLPKTIDGESVLIPNPQFTHRFFPPTLAREPLPFRIGAEKTPGTYRIFLLGESAAYGDPDPSFGMGRYLEALLEERYPANDFEVVCVAITAINSHVILPIARECAAQDGDLWVVYMGNNEMVGPYGAGTVFGERAPPLPFVRIALTLKSTRVGQLLGQITANFPARTDTPKTWEGINMFAKNQLRHDDPHRLRAYQNFKTNLDDILEIGRSAGIPIILSTVASNLKDCSPFASLPAADLTPEKRAEWKRHLEEGTTLETAGSFEAALAAYKAAAAIDATFAELLFRIGTCQLALKQNEAARVSFEGARDHDALAVRADTQINKIISEAILAADKGTVAGLDAFSALSAWTPAGIPGKELFYEHVHYTLEGNYLLARALAEKVEKLLPERFNARTEARTAQQEAELCNQRLATTLWDQKRVWDVALGRISVAPFTSQSSHPRNTRYCKIRIREVDTRTTPDSPIRDQEMYEAALKRAPADTLIRWNYAQFLERNGRLHEAVDQGALICKQLPHGAWAHYFTGTLLARIGRMSEAADYLVRALEISPFFPLATSALDGLHKSHPSLFTSDQ